MIQDVRYQSIPIIFGQRDKELHSNREYLQKSNHKIEQSKFNFRGARYYDSDVARFLGTDPLAADYMAWSTYNYVMGNPLIFVDPTGMGVEDWYQGEEGLVWSSESSDQITFNGKKYNNINKGSDKLPVMLQGVDGANLLISGHKDGDVYNNEWDKQTIQIANGNKTFNIFAIVNSKKDLINVFEIVTSNFGFVKDATIRAHGYSWGINLGQSVSDDFTDPTSINSFNQRLLSGDIKFESNSVVCFLGCNQMELAYSFTSITGVSSVGAIGSTGPQNSKGMFNVEQGGNSRGYYKFQRVIFTTDGILRQSLGKLFNASQNL